jgi:hypothetical protein
MMDAEIEVACGAGYAMTGALGRVVIERREAVVDLILTCTQDCDIIGQ